MSFASSAAVKSGRLRFRAPRKCRSLNLAALRASRTTTPGSDKRLQELIFGEAPRLPDCLNLLSVVQKGGVIDQPVWNLRLGMCTETEKGNCGRDCKMCLHMMLSQWTTRSRRMFVQDYDRFLV